MLFDLLNENMASTHFYNTNKMLIYFGALKIDSSAMVIVIIIAGKRREGTQSKERQQ